jgi:hypothetical protein
MAKKKMKTFLAVFLGTPAAMKRWDKLPARVRREREKEGMKAWHAWVARNAGSLCEPGAPLGSTKRIDRKGISNTRNQLAAFNVVRAPNHRAAAQLFRNHPHFMIFPGDSVEVMECLEVPGM